VKNYGITRRRPEGGGWEKISNEGWWEAGRKQKEGLLHPSLIFLANTNSEAGQALDH
jgi:hypothetical protein